MSGKFKVEIDGVDSDISDILNDMLKELDDKIKAQKRSSDKSDFTEVSGKLKEIDDYIMESLSESMISGEEATRESINSAIKNIHSHVLTRIETLKAISKEENFNDAKKAFEENLSNTVQRNLDSVDKDIEEEKDIASYEDRYEEAKSKKEFAYELLQKMQKGEIKEIKNDEISVDGIIAKRKDVDNKNRVLDGLTPEKIDAEIVKLYDMLEDEKVKDADKINQYDLLKEKIKSLIDEVGISFKDNTGNDISLADIKKVNDLKQQLMNLHLQLEDNHTKTYKELSTKIIDQKNENEKSYKDYIEGHSLYKLAGNEKIEEFIPKNGSMDEITMANKEFKQWKESTGIEEYVGKDKMSVFGSYNYYKSQEEQLSSLKDAQDKKEPEKEVIEEPDYSKIESDISKTDIKLADLGISGNPDVVLTARESVLGRLDDENNKLEFTRDILKPENKNKLMYAKEDIYNGLVNNGVNLTSLVPAAQVKKSSRIVEFFRKHLLRKKTTREEDSRKALIMAKIEDVIKEKINAIEDDTKTKKEDAKKEYDDKVKAADEKYDTEKKDFDSYVQIKGKDLEAYQKKVREEIVKGKSKDEAYKEAQKSMDNDYGMNDRS